MNIGLILKNASYLLSSNLLVRVITALASIWVARYLGVEDYGMLAVGLAFSGVAGYFTDMGITHTLIREGTKPNADIPALMGAFAKWRMGFALLTAAASALLIEVLYSGSDLRPVLYWMVMPTVLGANLVGIGAAYFQLTQQMKFTALIRTVAGLATAATLCLGIVFQWPLLLLAAVYGCSSLLGGVLSLWLVLKKVRLTQGGDAKALLQGLGSFMLGGLVVMLLPQLGPLVLERVADLTQVGYFAAAYRIPVVLYQFPGILAAAFYPLLFQYGNEKRLDEHLRLNVLQLKMMSLMGMLMAVPFLFYADWWVELLYGVEFAQASGLLAMLAVIVILQSINFPLADSLTTKGQQFRRTMVLIAAVVVGTALYAVLGSRYGATGGAYAALATEGVLLIGNLAMNRTGVQLLWRGLAVNLPAFAIVALLGFTVLRDAHPLIGAPLLGLLLMGLAAGLDRELRTKALGIVRARQKKTLNA